MYQSFYGFKTKPFQLTPDPEFLFMSRVHKRALTYLNYGVRDNYGFILLTGEIGTGKTTIIRTLLKQIPQEIKGGDFGRVGESREIGKSSLPRSFSASGKAAE